MNFAEKYGPWALVAGASEGTGRAFAEQIAGRGVDCILLARRTDPLGALADSLRRDHGIRCVTAGVDLACEDALPRIREAVGGREVGLFVSNAGADTTNRQFLDADIEDWVTQINRNVLNLTRCCHWLGTGMRDRRRGGMLLVGSGSCYGGAGYMAVYAGTKAYQLCLGEGLWAELQPHGVDVLSLILGQTDTPAFRESLARAGRPVPEGLASAVEVAQVGLSRLPFGPVHNWGLDDAHATPYIPSAAERRQRAASISQVMAGIFGGN